MTLSSRIPPHDLDAERAALGAALLDERSAELVAVCEPWIFYKEAHRAIARAITRLMKRGTPPDFITIRDELTATGELELVGGLPALALLIEHGAIASHTPAYLATAGKWAVRRELIQLGTHLVAEGYELRGQDNDKLIADTHARLLTLSGGGDNEILDAHQLFAGLLEQNQAQRHETGLPILDDLCDGLTGGHLTVLAGRPGMGKTAIACQVAQHLVRQSKVRTLFLSLEMQPREIAVRLLSLESGVNSRNIERGEYSPGAIAAAMEALSATGLLIQRAAVRQLPRVLALFREGVVRLGARVVIIDHVGKITGSRRESRYLEATEVIEEIKATAAHLSVPVLVLHQLNRAAEQRQSPRPILADLRDTGRVEEEADEILFVWTDEQRIDKDPLPVTLTLAKHRSGETGERPYLFQKSKGRFVERSPRNE